METNNTNELSEKDFALILEALEYLPYKNVSKKAMLAGLVEAIIPDGEKKQEYLAKAKIEEEQFFNELEIKIENIKILEGKLLTMKRSAQERKAMEEINNTLKNVEPKD